MVKQQFVVDQEIDLFYDTECPLPSKSSPNYEKTNIDVIPECLYIMYIRPIYSDGLCKDGRLP